MAIHKPKPPKPPKGETNPKREATFTGTDCNNEKLAAGLMFLGYNLNIVVEGRSY